MTFSTSHIALTAGITGFFSIPLTYWLLRPRNWIDVVGIAVVTAASVFLWRKSANMAQLNDDGLSPLSANDWLGPVLTYVFLGVNAPSGHRATRRGSAASGHCSRSTRW